MEDPHAVCTASTANLPPLGMSSFDQKQRDQFGLKVRLAMACIEGGADPTPGKAIPMDENSIRLRLKALSQEITSQHADLLELLVRFDDLEGWKNSGANHCASWMNTEIGIGMQSAWGYLRVGRKLRTLPTLQTLFRAGKLSWSKVRLITRVADESNEKLLCHAALDAAVSDVQRLCQEYRWQEDESGTGENDRAMKQWESRSFRWDEASNGSTRIQLTLPPEIAQAFLASVEHSLNQLGDTGSECRLSQRRADAAVLKAETSLLSAGKDVATADRYQVIVSLEASDLVSKASPVATAAPGPCEGASSSPIHECHTMPKKRPTVKGAGPIAQETARRIACDCSVSVNNIANGEPTDIGRKSRIWPTAMARTIKERDQHCVWPGCTQSHHLHIHHIQHWADGGATSVENGASLCSHHHTLVHEGGYTIERVEGNDGRETLQYIRQQHAHDISQLPIEVELRNNRSSFDKVRKLSPTRYRFKVTDALGRDIESTVAESSVPIRIDPRLIESEHTVAVSPSPLNRYAKIQGDDYTRVGCAEPIPAYYPNVPVSTGEHQFPHCLRH